MKKFLFPLAATVAVVLLGQISFGQALYSYTDDSGVRVFTNIPPVNQVQDLVVTGSVPSPASNSKPESEPYDAIIEKYATHYRLDPSLIRSIIETESGFDPKAVSPKGAGGLMQLMPATAERLGVRNIFDPEQNIRGGTQHFRLLMDTFDNNLELSLAAYNAGENLVQRLGRVPKIRETKNYIQSVTKRYEKSDKDGQILQELQHPPAFRFRDDSGVLHLTNIPPLH
jgi:soluble lytic murein transglycosylase-like protein